MYDLRMSIVYDVDDSLALPDITIYIAMEGVAFVTVLYTNGWIDLLALPCLALPCLGLHTSIHTMLTLLTNTSTQKDDALALWLYYAMTPSNVKQRQ